MKVCARFGLVILAAITGCRGCTRSPSDALRDVPGVAPRAVAERARCREHIAHATVATAPGWGELDALALTCGDDDTLAVWMLRGHTLSRSSKRRGPSEPFSPALIVSSAAARLGVVASTAHHGPVAWRAPTLMFDALGDQWWTATGPPLRLGTFTPRTGTVGLGVLGVGATVGARVEVFGSVAAAEQNPAVHRRWIGLDAMDDDADANAGTTIVAEGELKAWEPAHRRALVYRVAPDGSRSLHALALDADGHATSDLAVARLEHQNVLVVANGVARGEDSWFAFAEFDMVRADARACLQLGPTTCVAATPPRVAGVGPSGVRVTVTDTPALLDTLGTDERARLVLLGVGDASREGEQVALRFDPGSGRAERLFPAPSDDLPAIDHPVLASCGNELWLAAEVRIERTDEDGAALARPEPAVIAIPAGCVFAERPTGPR